MAGSRYLGRGAWITAVDRALTRADTRQVLALKDIDPEVVLAVACAEASRATDGGVSTLSHSQLAELTGHPRSAVLRARLALVELGLEDLAAVPGVPGNCHRELRHY